MAKLQNRVMLQNEVLRKQMHSGFCNKICIRSPIAANDAAVFSNVFNLRSADLSRQAEVWYNLPYCAAMRRLGCESEAEVVSARALNKKEAALSTRMTGVGVPFAVGCLNFNAVCSCHCCCTCREVVMEFAKLSAE